MPTKQLVFLLLLSVLLFSCKKDSVDGQRLEMLPVSVDIQAGLNPIQAHSFIIPDIKTQHAEFEKSTGVKFSEWKNIKPLKARLTIITPGLNWEFAQEISLKGYVDNVSNQKEIFYRDPVPVNNGPSLDLIPSEFNALELLQDDRVSLVLELRRMKYSPQESFQVRIDWSFDALK